VEITQDDVVNAASGKTEKVDNQIRFAFFPVGSKLCHYGASGGPAGKTTVYLGSQALAIIVVNGTIVNSNVRYIDPDGLVYEGTINVGTRTTILTQV